ncbi:hypothetical protein [Streptomyces radiopugnans]|uniref:hypothetical protein n=1 Tax=Streptomyces radiopugnans TaxID=403935 RepID=UPI003F1CAAE8
MPPQQDAPPPTARKRRRFFLWFFLAIQVLFLIWVITGAASGDTAAECAGLTGDELELCEDAAGVGTAIGVGVIIFLWAAVDIILALTYLVYRLATRQPRA